MIVPEPLITGVGMLVHGESDVRRLGGAGPVGDPRTRVDPAEIFGRRGLRYKDRATCLSLVAARAALTDAGLLADGALTVESDSVGVVVSTNLGNADTVCGVAETIRRGSVAQTSPMDLPNASSNVVAASIAIRFALRGVNLTLCNGATSGLDAMYWARVLCATRTPRVLIVGVEPATAVARRLQSERDVLDGAVALVVEHPRAAAERDASALATVAGCSRRPSLGEAVRAICPSVTAIDRWFTPEDATHAPGPPLAAADAHDLASRLGRASGALGVLQCAAGSVWLAERGSGTALATAGGGETDDAAAAVLLRAAGERR